MTGACAWRLEGGSLPGGWRTIRSLDPDLEALVVLRYPGTPHSASTLRCWFDKHSDTGSRMLSRVLLVVALAAAAHAAAVAEESDRDSKLFPVINIITFDNAPCTAQSGEMGTCYSQKECEGLSGTPSGTCANGFGICCVLTATCDGTISVNGTYFTSPGYPSTYSTPGTCMVELLPPAGTCQILLEFESFNLMGPVNGDCNNDTFIVMGANAGSRIPVICGANTGQHMYIDVDQSNGPYKMMVTSSALAYPRSWKIKVTFLDENDPCKAPPRCLQYFKETSGAITSFNFGPEPMMLTNQEYCICFGYNPGFCDIGMNFNRLDLGNINGNCGNDYLAVGAEKLCGDFGTLTAQANATGPISLCVFSDDNNDREEEGFNVNYLMLAC
ncbi:neuropilin-1 isoform X1 [Penaeus vannamei]|uniref:CUB domain-containing protein n=1 Tax=Penaeus vannamei TaxID=6689 RepID=A0A423SPY0_PENVA|nr:neuropilin-1-like isoform X1 [Penaeus vannamei]ROT66267.1 hypothetical protein C7M84_015729 [Penaeus vannamei]